MVKYLLLTKRGYDIIFLMSDYTPKYLKIKEMDFNQKISQAYSLLQKCTLCPRNCEVNRTEGEKGYCKSGTRAVISSFSPHFGEEEPLVGKYGSGTIFFTNCNLLCVFCQNYDISHQGYGKEITTEKLAEIMLYLQGLLCHNINFVTPTHFTPQILEAVKIAKERGLNIPLVYNCGGYEKVETLKLLEGIIDIYMPDFKFSDSAIGKKLANAEDYFEIAKNSLKEMQGQVGDLILDEKGIAKRGIILRHLVLPEGLAGTDKIFKFIKDEISANIYINIMDQYRPCGQAGEFPSINRRITSTEYQEAVNMALKYKLTNQVAVENKGCL